MNITNPTTFSSPALVYSTSNSSGTAGALRADDTLAIFSTTVPTNVTAATVAAATGDNAFGSREDHVHGTTAIPAPVFSKVVRTGGNVTTTSTSLVDFTGASITFTTGAFPVRYAVAQCGQNGALTKQVRMNVDLDSGTLMHGSSGLFIQQEVAGLVQNLSFSGQTAALSAAEHTIKFQWSVDTNTGTMLATSTNSHMFSAEEIR